MSSEKSLAIVTRLIPYSESSYIATLFTEDFGKVTALAKGARKPKSSFASALDLLSVSRIVFLRKSSDALDLLTEASLERPFRSSIRNLSPLYAGYYALELINSLTDDRDPNPPLFRILLETVTAFDSGADVADRLVRFELAMLRVLGQLPSLFDCAECGNTVYRKPRIAFGQLSGGILCDDCKPGKRHVISISFDGIEAMRKLSAAKSSVTSASVGDSTETLEMSIKGEVRAVMNRYISHVLGRRPRLFDYLGFG